MNKRVNRKELETLWLHEEEIAHIRGWDFSHIRGKYEEERDLPWDYETMVRRYLGPDMRLLDIDTGGGEFLLSLGHPRNRLAATENYPPNVRLCREKLSDVLEVESRSKYNLILRLSEGASQWNILERMKEEGIEIDQYGSYEPSLNDIFVSCVGDEVPEDTQEEGGRD